MRQCQEKRPASRASPTCGQSISCLPEVKKSMGGGLLNERARFGVAQHVRPEGGRASLVASANNITGPGGSAIVKSCPPASISGWLPSTACRTTSASSTCSLRMRSVPRLTRLTSRRSSRSRAM